MTSEIPAIGPDRPLFGRRDGWCLYVGLWLPFFKGCSWNVLHQEWLNKCDLADRWGRTASCRTASSWSSRFRSGLTTPSISLLMLWWNAEFRSIIRGKWWAPLVPLLPRASELMLGLVLGWAQRCLPVGGTLGKRPWLQLVWPAGPCSTSDYVKVPILLFWTHMFELLTLKSKTLAHEWVIQSHIGIAYYHVGAFVSHFTLIWAINRIKTVMSSSLQSN